MWTAWPDAAGLFGGGKAGARGRGRSVSVNNESHIVVAPVVVMMMVVPGAAAGAAAPMPPLAGATAALGGATAPARSNVRDRAGRRVQGAGRIVRRVGVTAAGAGEAVALVE